MKLFQSIQKSFSLLGISQNQSRFNDRMLLAASIFSAGTTLNIVFVFTGTKTFREFTDAVYVACATAVFLICFAKIVFKMDKLFKLIDFIENIVDKSKLKMHDEHSFGQNYIFVIGSEHPEMKVMYIEVNRQVEKLSDIAYLVMVKVTPVCLILPKIVISVFVYFTTDLGYDALELPSPTRWDIEIHWNSKEHTQILFVVICVIFFSQATVGFKASNWIHNCFHVRIHMHSIQFCLHPRHGVIWCWILFVCNCIGQRHQNQFNDNWNHTKNEKTTFAKKEAIENSKTILCYDWISFHFQTVEWF